MDDSKILLTLALIAALKRLADGTSDDSDIHLIQQAIERGAIEISASDEFQGAIIKTNSEGTLSSEEYFSFAENSACSYVISATNQMYSLLNGEYPEQQLTKVVQIGRTTLNRLLDDQAFYRNVAKAIRLREENYHDCKTIVEDVEHFAKFFLSREWDVLVIGGINPDLASDITYQATKLRESVRDLLNHRDGIIGNVRRLRVQLSKLVDELERIELGDKNREKTKQRLLRITYAVGGVSTVVLNVTVGTILFSPAGSALSSVVGGAFIQEAMKID